MITYMSLLVLNVFKGHNLHISKLGKNLNVEGLFKHCFKQVVSNFAFDDNVY